MIFKDILIKYESKLRPEFERLLEQALSNQYHPNDLLIWENNGFYDETIFNFRPPDGKTYNPHVVGLGEIGHSEIAHYKFIHQYRQAYLSKQTFEEYEPTLEYSKERRDEIDKLIEFEETTINLELLIYLKFWEADNIIKKFYELVRILNSKHYDWYFKIAESNRDKEATGNRQDIIRLMIRDNLQKDFPVLYDAIKIAYRTQIRNAIAHSKYSFQQRNIHIHNYIKDDPHAKIKNIPFNEWIELFHTTIVIHNEYIRLGNSVREIYSKKAMASGNILPILITEQSGKQYEMPFAYDPGTNHWGYYQK